MTFFLFFTPSTRGHYPTFIERDGRQGAEGDHPRHDFHQHPSMFFWVLSPARQPSRSTVKNKINIQYLSGNNRSQVLTAAYRTIPR